MPAPVSAPPSPKLETNSGTTPGKVRRSSKHKKHHGKTSSRSEAPLTWKEQLGQLLAVLLTAAVVYTITVAAIGWLKEARKPFCDNGEPVQDGCKPCPENGLCQDGKLRCLPGFRRQGNSCVPDKQIDKIAQKLVLQRNLTSLMTQFLPQANFVQNKVCRISGQSLCDGGETTWVPEEQLWDATKETQMGLDAEKAWLVHEKALDLVRDNLNIRINDFGMREFECPAEIAKTYQPLSCWIRKGIKANIYGVLLTAFIVGFLAIYILRNLQHRRLVARAEELYLQVCEVLGEKAVGANKDTKWVVASRLRDHLLLPSERKLAGLWKEVEIFVQEDSRIDQYPKVVNGESRIVWEWQGNCWLYKGGREGASH